MELTRKLRKRSDAKADREWSTVRCRWRPYSALHGDPPPIGERVEVFTTHSTSYVGRFEADGSSVRFVPRKRGLSRDERITFYRLIDDVA
jgi:hypothetical protein